MPVLAAAGPARRSRTVLTTFLGFGVGSILVVGGVGLGYLAFTTGFVSTFTAARPGAVQSMAGVAAWAIALVAPALFVIVGAVRLVDTLDAAQARRPRPRPAARLSDRLPEDHVVVTRVRLLDGRLVPEIVVGPFGVAVIEEVPPPQVSRRRGANWEIRTSSGAWRPVEGPLDRATRDAERVRRWLAHEDHDHIVKVYAAVVAPPEAALARTPECAVVTLEQLQGWLASLPPQRSLNADRQANVVDLLRGAMA